MTHASSSPTPIRGLFARLTALAVYTLVALLAPDNTTAAPEFLLTGRAADLDQRIVAEDELGPVTALEVLLYLKMSNRAEASIPVEFWLGQADDPGKLADIRSLTREYLTMRRLAREGSAEGCPDDYRRALIYPGAVAAWIELTVQPQIQITDTDLNRYYIAHSETYAAPDRAQVRYVFLPVEDMADPEQTRAGQARMEEIRGRVLRGEMTFAEAARQFSKAPSAAQGGLLPEFTRDQFFQEFTHQAFQLEEIGQMSPVFLGKDGVYLLQLVKMTRVRKLEFEEVEDEIRDVLSRDMVASYYRFIFEKLASKTFTQDYSPLWQYQNLSAPVARLGEVKLRRDLVYHLNPSLINADYQLQWSVIQDVTRNWLEGEAILQDLERRGDADHIYIQKAREVADILIAGRDTLRKRVAPASYATVEAALQTLGMEPTTGQVGVRQSRIIQIALNPAPEALATPGVAEITAQTMRELGAKIQSGQIPIRPEPIILSETLTPAINQGQEAMRLELDRIRGLVIASPYANVKIEITDLGWKDSLPFIAWSPLLPSLRPGEVSPGQQVGPNLFYYYNAANRLDPQSPWMEKPLALQSLAHDVAMQEKMTEAAAAIPESALKI